MTDSEIIKSIYADLVRRGRVYSLREFSTALGYNRTYLSEVVNDTRRRGLGMSNELKKVLVEVFNINPLYLATGIGEMYGDGGSMYTPIKRSDDIEKGVDTTHISEALSYARELIDTQKSIIESLREKIKSFEK